MNTMPGRRADASKPSCNIPKAKRRAISWRGAQPRGGAHYNAGRWQASADWLLNQDDTLAHSYRSAERGAYVMVRYSSHE